MSGHGVLTTVPTEATDEEAAKLYEKIMGMIKQMNPEKEAEFSTQCQNFGTCPIEQGESSFTHVTFQRIQVFTQVFVLAHEVATAFLVFLDDAFTADFKVIILPELVRLVPDESKRRLLLEMAGIYKDPSKTAVNQAIGAVSKIASFTASTTGFLLGKAFEFSKEGMTKGDAALSTYMQERERLGKLQEETDKEQAIRNKADSTVRSALNKAELMKAQMQAEHAFKQFITPEYQHEEQLTLTELLEKVAAQEPIWEGPAFEAQATAVKRCVQVGKMCKGV